MTDRERYKRAFSALEPSRTFSMEVETMKKNGRRKWSKALVSVCVAAALVIAGATAAYAADFAGFRETVTLWARGSEIQGTLVQTGEYSYRLDDQDGTPVKWFYFEDDFASSATEEQLQEAIQFELEMPFVVPELSGGYTLYFYDQVVDLTEDLKEKDSVDVELDHDGVTYQINVFTFTDNGERKVGWSKPKPVE